VKNGPISCQKSNSQGVSIRKRLQLEKPRECFNFRTGEGGIRHYKGVQGIEEGNILKKGRFP